MAVATLHLADVGGFPGSARCWQLDPPAQVEGRTVEYVTVYVQEGYAHQAPEVCTVPALKDSGAVDGRSVRRIVGSFTLGGDPDSPEYVDGCHFLALQFLGGYNVTVPDGEGEE